MQIEIDLPSPLADVLSERARAEGISLNEFVARVLVRGVDGRSVPLAKRDLSFLGRMTDADARAIEEAHALMDGIGMLGAADADRT